jgi:hypothetical protein
LIKARFSGNSGTARSPRLFFRWVSEAPWWWGGKGWDDMKMLANARPADKVMTIIDTLGGKKIASPGLQGLSAPCAIILCKRE